MKALRLIRDGQEVARITGGNWQFGRKVNPKRPFGSTEMEDDPNVVKLLGEDGKSICVMLLVAKNWKAEEVPE